FECAPEQHIGFAGTVNIGGQEGADSLIVGAADESDETVVLQRFAKVHETSCTPHSKSGSCQLHRPKIAKLSNHPSASAHAFSIVGRFDKIAFRRNSRFASVLAQRFLQSAPGEHCALHALRKLSHSAQ